MDCFEKLGIEPTTDTKELKRAYTRLLKQYPPETNPDKFQEIRDAYEQALALQKDGNLTQNQTSEDPIEQFLLQLKAIYDDYNSRVDTGAWQQLLDADVCHHIDTRETIQQELLTFLMDNYYLPHQVWVLFNEHFAWDQNKDKLYEQYHPNFVNYLLSRIERDNFFRYEELVGCEAGQQDVFIQEYNSGMNAIDNFDYYAAYQAMKKAEEICPNHPDLLILWARYDMATGKLEEAYQTLNQLVERDQDDYDAHYYRANLLFRMGRFTEAFEDYLKIIQVRPREVDVLFSLGKTAVGLQKYPEAIQYLQELRQILQNDHEVDNLLDSAYRFRVEELVPYVQANPEDLEATKELATAYLATNYVEEAYQILCQLEKTNPSASIFVQMCQALDRMEKKELALVTLNRGLEQYPQDEHLLHWKADVLEELGNREEAIVYYDKALEINPTFATTHNNKSYALNKLGHFLEALEAAEKAIQLDPHMPNGFKNKAEALLGLERYAECYEACDEALRLHQNYVEAFVIKMEMLTRVEQYDDAIGIFNETADLQLRDSRLFYQKAHALRLKGELEEAITVCEEALSLDERNVDALYCKGMSYFYLEQYDEALQELEKVIEISPFEPAYYYQACSYYNTMRKDIAQRLSLEALERGVDREDLFYDLLGDIHRDQEEKEEALSAYTKANELNPSAGYEYQIGLLLEEGDTYQECLQHLNQALEMDPTLIGAYEAKIRVLFTFVKDYEGCIEVCDQVLEEDPDNLYAIDYKAWSYYMMDQYEEAMTYVREGLARDPDFISILHLKIFLLKEMGEDKEALSVCDHLLELDPEHEEANQVRKELLKKGKKDSLFKWFT